MLIIDFAKVFDMVDHDILLRELCHQGIRGIPKQGYTGLAIRGNTHDWLKYYPTNRKQYESITISGENSSQGSN